jgi:hypothetical protein
MTVQPRQLFIIFWVFKLGLIIRTGPGLVKFNIVRSPVFTAILIKTEVF